MKRFILYWFLVIASNHALTQTCICHIPVPEYPRLARISEIHGAVHVAIMVRPDGTVDSARPSGGHRILEEAAVENVRQWTFCPSSAGQTTKITITFSYNLEGHRQYADPPPKVVLDLPQRVEVTSRPYSPQPNRDELSQSRQPTASPSPNP